ncbi:MAG: hypothetical protein FOGNACKC_03853 [Anaerolineae bacterium]|nr:hypothetical protein [Anaerolineae bacterium]
MSEKLVIVCTHGPDDPELATIPFVMATAAQASDVEVVMLMQARAVLLARQGIANHIHAENFPPLAELLDVFVEMGGKMLLCGPCFKSRQLSDDILVEGAEMANAGAQIAEIMSATNVLTY